MSLDVCMNSSAYAPSSLVETFHGIPHIDINLDRVPDSFELTTEYFEAIIIWACVPILAVICMLIVMSVYFICVCCCCCCQQHEPRSKKSKGFCGTLVILLILFSLACCGAALWAEFTLNSNFSSATSSAMNINDLTQDVKSQANTLNSSVVGSTVEDLRTAIVNTDPSNTGYDNAVAAVDLLSGTTTTVQDSLTRIKREANIQDFSSALEGIEYIELLRHWVVVGYLILTILVFFLLIISVCCGAICNTPTCMVIALVFLGFYAVTMWIAVGANLAYLVVAGDICNEPDALIRRQFINATTADLPAETLDYYLICDEACYPNPFAAAQMEASSALMNITELQEAISGYITGNSLDIPEYEPVVSAFEGGLSSINNITILTNCTLLNTDYLSILDGMCTDGYFYSLILFSMACGIAVMFIVILFCGSFYAGLFAKGRLFDDETIVYDFPNDGGPSPWESYGTQQHRYHNTQPQYNDNSFNMSSSAIEPPKYADLGTEETSMMNNGARVSGAFDNLA